ncbi:MAG TPA: small, acid-soluble spore protein, alpha/beta type [Firmicutes bacterium]|nr:small, acid-soluble spore protein, alpha/beta type [Bacillota bacterium]
MKTTKKKQNEQLSPLELLKMEVAEELGLLEKIRKVGWGGLSAAESGRIGGVMTQRLKEKSEGER